MRITITQDDFIKGFHETYSATVFEGIPAGT